MTTTLTAPDLAPLLATCAEFPEDIGPRLVLADFLEEQGDPHAEYIRVSCELAEVDPNWLGTLPCCMGMESRCTRCLRSMRKLEAIRQRSRDLFARHGGEWARRVFAGVKLAGVQKNGWHISGDPSITANSLSILNLTIEFDWHNGLPDIFRVPTLAAWMGEACYCTTDSQFRASGMCKKCNGLGRVGGIAAALRGRVPVREVWCGDREPWSNNINLICWFNASRPMGQAYGHPQSEIPGELFGLLEGGTTWAINRRMDYPTPDAARLAFARAVGRWTQSFS